MDRHSYSPRRSHYCVIACLFLLGIFAPRLWRESQLRQVLSPAARPPSSLITERIDPLQPQDPAVSHIARIFVRSMPAHEQSVAATGAIERTPQRPSERPSLYIQELGPPKLDRSRRELAPDFLSVKPAEDAENNLPPDVQPRVLRIARKSALADHAAAMRRTSVNHARPDRDEPAPKLPVLRRVTDPIVLRSATDTVASAAGRRLRLTGSQARLPRDVEKDRLEPLALLRQLRRLASPPVAVDWADQVISLLQSLAAAVADPDRSISPALDQLSALAARGENLAVGAEVDAERRALLIASYAIVRRVVLWRGFRAILEQTRPVDVRPYGDTKNVARWVATAHDRLATVDHPEQWRGFLLLDDARELTKPGARLTVQHRRNLAESILRRLSSPKLSPRQREFFTTPPFPQLTRSLQRWVSEPVDYGQLLNDLERYELSGRREVARRVAEQHNLLRWSPSLQLRQLGEQVNVHYRNANLRVVVSEEFLNRFLPILELQEMPIDECVQGVRVEGSSQVRTELALRLIPAPWSWRLQLEARGVVDSYTESSSWPVKLVNRGHARYQAHKLLLVDSLGAFSDRSHAATTSETALTDLQTPFDVIPLMRLLVRSLVLREYEKAQPRAQQEMEERVSRTVEQQLDGQVQQSLSASKQQIENRLLGPLRRLGLQPRVVHLQTAERQLIGRYRLASDRQLAAHTPRPRAPAGSDLSVQIHESALNNALEQLHFDGREMELRQWVSYLFETLDRGENTIPDDLPEHVKVRFADDEAVRVTLVDGRLELALQFAEVSDRRNRWRNFAVSVWYRPERNGLTVKLVRDGYISIAGRTRKLALRAIFAKVFSKARPVTLLDLEGLQESRRRGLHVAQCVIRDGWIGAAVGPSRATIATRHFVSDSE